MAKEVKVEVEGLREFRRDLRRADKVVGKEFQRALRTVSVTVAAEAAALAPRVTGTLAGSYRGAAVGSRGIIRSKVFYARFIEFGFHPGGGDTFIEGTHPIGRAIAHQEDRIIDGIGDAVDRAATQMGWH